MWILQIRSENDGLDLIYTCNSEDLADELKALYFDVWTGNDCFPVIEPGRFTLIRQNDNVIMAQLWQEY